jgi:hypothetical protein
MDRKHIVVGEDADTEAEARALAEEMFGPKNVVRGERIDHRKGCPEYKPAIVGVGDCDCPRVTIFSNARELIS